MPEWYTTLTQIELQVKELRDEIPIDLIGSRNDIKDLEMFDLRISAMQSRIKKALKELQYASDLGKDVMIHLKENLNG
jgi:hypothetical protein